MTASSSTQQLPTNPTLLCDKYISSFYYDSQTSTLSIRPLFHKGSSGDALNLLAVEKEYILHDDDSNSKDSSVLLGRQMKKMRLFRVPSHLRCPNCNREIASVDIKEHSELCRYDIEPLPYPTINSNENSLPSPLPEINSDNYNAMHQLETILTNYNKIFTHLNTHFPSKLSGYFVSRCSSMIITALNTYLSLLQLPQVIEYLAKICSLPDGSDIQQSESSSSSSEFSSSNSVFDSVSLHLQLSTFLDQFSQYINRLLPHKVSITNDQEHTIYFNIHLYLVRLITDILPVLAQFLYPLLPNRTLKQWLTVLNNALKPPTSNEVEKPNQHSFQVNNSNTRFDTLKRLYPSSGTKNSQISKCISEELCLTFDENQKKRYINSSIEVFSFPENLERTNNTALRSTQVVCLHNLNQAWMYTSILRTFVLQKTAFPGLAIMLTSTAIGECVKELDLADRFIQLHSSKQHLPHFCEIVPLSLAFLELVIEWHWISVLTSLPKPNKVPLSIVDNIVTILEKLRNLAVKYPRAKNAENAIYFDFTEITNSNIEWLPSNQSSSSTQSSSAKQSTKSPSNSSSSSSQTKETKIVHNNDNRVIPNILLPQTTFSNLLQCGVSNCKDQPDTISFEPFSALNPHLILPESLLIKVRIEPPNNMERVPDVLSFAKQTILPALELYGQLLVFYSSISKEDSNENTTKHLDSVYSTLLNLHYLAHGVEPTLGQDSTYQNAHHLVGSDQSGVLHDERNHNKVTTLNAPQPTLMISVKGEESTSETSSPQDQNLPSETSTSQNQQLSSLEHCLSLPCARIFSSPPILPTQLIVNSMHKLINAFESLHKSLNSENKSLPTNPYIFFEWERLIRHIESTFRNHNFYFLGKDADLPIQETPSSQSPMPENTNSKLANIPHFVDYTTPEISSSGPSDSLITEFYNINSNLLGIFTSVYSDYFNLLEKSDLFRYLQTYVLPALFEFGFSILYTQNSIQTFQAHIDVVVNLFGNMLNYRNNYKDTPLTVSLSPSNLFIKLNILNAIQKKLFPQSPINQSSPSQESSSDGKENSSSLQQDIHLASNYESSLKQLISQMTDIILSNFQINQSETKLVSFHLNTLSQLPTSFTRSLHRFYFSPQAEQILNQEVYYVDKDSKTTSPVDSAFHFTVPLFGSTNNELISPRFMPLVYKGHVLVRILTSAHHAPSTSLYADLHSRPVCCLLCGCFFAADDEYAVFTECPLKNAVYTAIKNNSEEFPVSAITEADLMNVLHVDSSQKGSSALHQLPMESSKENHSVPEVSESSSASNDSSPDAFTQISEQSPDSSSSFLPVKLDINLFTLICENNILNSRFRFSPLCDRKYLNSHHSNRTECSTKTPLKIKEPHIQNNQLTLRQTSPTTEYPPLSHVQMRKLSPPEGARMTTVPIIQEMQFAHRDALEVRHADSSQMETVNTKKQNTEGNKTSTSSIIATPADFHSSENFSTQNLRYDEFFKRIQDSLSMMDFPILTVTTIPTYYSLHSSPAFWTRCSLSVTQPSFALWPSTASAFPDGICVPGPEKSHITPRFVAHDIITLASNPSLSLWVQGEHQMYFPHISSTDSISPLTIVKETANIPKKKKQGSKYLITPDCVYLTASENVTLTRPRFADLTKYNIVLLGDHKSDLAIHLPSSIAQVSLYLMRVLQFNPGRLFIYGFLASPSYFLLIRCERKLSQGLEHYEYLHTPALLLTHGGWWWWRQLLTQPLYFFGIDMPHPSWPLTEPASDQLNLLQHSLVDPTPAKGDREASQEMTIETKTDDRKDKSAEIKENHIEREANPVITPYSLVYGFNPMDKLSVRHGRSTLLTLFNYSPRNLSDNHPLSPRSELLDDFCPSHLVLKSSRYYYSHSLSVEAQTNCDLVMYERCSSPTNSEQPLSSFNALPKHTNSLSSAHPASSSTNSTFFLKPIPWEKIPFRDKHRLPLLYSPHTMQVVYRNLGSPVVELTPLITDSLLGVLKNHLLKIITSVNNLQQNLSKHMEEHFTLNLNYTELSLYLQKLVYLYEQLPMAIEQHFTTLFNDIFDDLFTLMPLSTNPLLSFQDKMAFLERLQNKLNEFSECISKLVTDTPPKLHLQCNYKSLMSVLHDLCRLHNLGLCHRDISPRNITVLHPQPGSFSDEEVTYLIDLGSVAPLDTPVLFYGDVLFASDNILTQLSNITPNAPQKSLVLHTRRDELIAFLKVCVMPYLRSRIQRELHMKTHLDIKQLASHTLTHWEKINLTEKLAVCGFTTLLGDPEFAASESLYSLRNPLYEENLIKPFNINYKLSPLAPYHRKSVVPIENTSINAPEFIPISPECASEILSVFGDTDSLHALSDPLFETTDSGLYSYDILTPSLIYHYDCQIWNSPQEINAHILSFGEYKMFLKQLENLPETAAASLEKHVTALVTSFKEVDFSDTIQPESPLDSEYVVTVPGTRNYGFKTLQGCPSLAFSLHNRLSHSYSLQDINMLNQLSPLYGFYSIVRFAFACILYSEEFPNTIDMEMFSLYGLIRSILATVFRTISESKETIDKPPSKNLRGALVKCFPKSLPPIKLSFYYVPEDTKHYSTYETLARIYPSFTSFTGVTRTLLLTEDTPSHTVTVSSVSPSPSTIPASFPTIGKTSFTIFQNNSPGTSENNGNTNSGAINPE